MKYEDEAVQLFETKTGKTVLLFGLMPFFGRSSYLGGSVDGVTACGADEAKCPYRRKLNGKVQITIYPRFKASCAGCICRRRILSNMYPKARGQQYFCATVVKRDDDFLDRYHAYLREFWYRVCTCRVNADAMCFQPNERKEKNTALRIQLPDGLKCTHQNKLC